MAGMGAMSSVNSGQLADGAAVIRTIPKLLTGAFCFVDLIAVISSVGLLVLMREGEGIHCTFSISGSFHVLSNRGFCGP